MFYTICNAPALQESNRTKDGLLFPNWVEIAQSSHFHLQQGSKCLRVIVGNEVIQTELTLFFCLKPITIQSLLPWQTADIS